MFRQQFQVYVNYDLQGNNNIGIVTLVKKDLTVVDQLISLDGRILGIKCQNIQIWNVYPLSGGENKKSREIFFRETLNNLMMNWKDHSKYVFQIGDHNCTYRMKDSLNNAGQHIQQGLISHLKIHGLKDGWVQVHGEGQTVYSRITNRSSTRIDFIFSNANTCTHFEYIDTGLGLDHKAVFGRYDIEIKKTKENIPKHRFYSPWVIPKFLETDKVFSEGMQCLFDDILFEYYQEGEENISFFWEKAKILTKKLARDRENTLNFEENNRLNVLVIYYSTALLRLEEGENCKQEIIDIKAEINQIQNLRSKKLIDKMRELEVDDYVYDIHKLQKERKYENQKTISELKIGEETFKGTQQVVGGIQTKMMEELKPFGNKTLNEPATQEELNFLDLIPFVEWTTEEVNKLIGPTTEEEISNILKFEVDLDSAPGEDGITYRFIKHFWTFKSYRRLYLTFLNNTKSEGNLGYVNNLGIMVVKNKNKQSIEYDKKRKLTKVNKDLNMGHGKVWTNRMKEVVLPKILPKTQFNCQKDRNITDEVREIRSVNHYLLGLGNQQIDGTILSIDFSNAFRSTSLRWLNLVLQRFNLPNEFLDWLWMMYTDLGIMIVVNKYKSDILKVERGFMEGHPPSMALFVVALTPLMIALENILTGITTNDGKKHKIKGFADDLKIFLKDLNEIEPSYNAISNFEGVSGLKMHRDPKREKCQALPFGRHKLFQQWPNWVTVKDVIKVVGVHFSNVEGNFETLNSKLVAQNFYNGLQQWQGTRGTVFQKVYIVNTFLFSKLWYVAQAVQLDEKLVKTMLKKALDFIYGGENERPVRAVNFRSKEKGGLGLIHPIIKARALLIKSIQKDFIQLNCSINDNKVKALYGYSKDFKELFEANLSSSNVKTIYNKLIEKITFKNGSLIPSRNEKRTEGIKWGLTWNNFQLLRGLDSEEKMFGWKVIQDMLPVGRRIHRQNVEKRCLIDMEDGSKCQIIPDIYHVLKDCNGI